MTLIDVRKFLHDRKRKRDLKQNDLYNDNAITIRNKLLSGEESSKTQLGKNSIINESLYGDGISSIPSPIKRGKKVFIIIKFILYYI